MTDRDTALPTVPDALWTQECARRASLASMGITPLVSRHDPIGAKPATRYRAPEPFGQEHRVEMAGAETEMQGAQLRALIQGSDEKAPSRAEPNQPEPVSVSAAPAPRAGEELAQQTPLSLLMVTSGDVLWMEVLEDQLLRQEQLQLIAAMARAIRGPSVRCQHQQFDWPPAGQSALAAAQGGMADVLSGFLQRLTSDHGTELMVLLGPCECLPGSSLPSHVIPSSLDMLRDGALKQTAWGTLKPLCRSA